MKVVEKKLVDETPGKTEGGRRATGVFSAEEAPVGPPVAAGADTEALAKTKRRRFTAEYKQQIVVQRHPVFRVKTTPSVPHDTGGIPSVWGVA